MQYIEWLREVEELFWERTEFLVFEIFDEVFMRDLYKLRLTPESAVESMMTAEV